MVFEPVTHFYPDIAVFGVHMIFIMEKFHNAHIGEVDSLAHTCSLV